MAHFDGLPVPMLPISHLYWRIEKPFTYFSDVDAGHVVRIRAGFITDFASVPRLLWSLYPRWGSYGYAAIVHDYLYGEDTQVATREIADQIFFEAMRVQGVPLLRANVLYFAVRFGGGFSWRTK